MKRQDSYLRLDDYNDEDLRRIISYAGKLLEERRISKVTYENEFIDIMLKCGLDIFSAKMSLQDFKTLCEIFIPQTEPLYLEDVQSVLRIVIQKNGYAANTETDRLFSEFVMDSFGNNIPSLRAEESPC